MGTQAGNKTSAAEERASGWNTLFKGISALGDVATGYGAGLGAYKEVTAK